jgi:uncharacterized protein (DUF1697 family)
MALIVLLRGINVGGHRTFRPTLLAQRLGKFDAVNIGATGTFVIRKPGSRARLRAELRARLPVTTQFVFCDGRDLLRLDADERFHKPPSESGSIRFVSFLAKAPRLQRPVPFTIPQGKEWFVRVTALTGRLAVGEYRRHMKTIGYLGQLDTLLGTPVTTRSWSTVNAILQVLKDGSGTSGKEEPAAPREVAR